MNIPGEFRQSLLRLNNYLPVQFQTSDENQLIDILEVILSTQLLINNIGSSETELPTLPLPLDVQTEIIVNSHPYYANKVCMSSNKLLPVCKQNRYEIFQKWCEPNMSIDELKRELKTLTWNDVIQVALLYHPLPISLKYWDSINLAYYALVNNQEDVDVYLEPAFKTNKHFLVSLMCYKFNELDRLYRFAIENDNIYDYTVYMMLYYKLNRAINNEDTQYINSKIKIVYEKKGEASGISFETDLVRYIRDIIPYITNTLFTFEDIIEFVIIHNIVFFNYRRTNPYYTIIDQIEDDYITDSDLFIMYAVLNYGFDETDALIASYGNRDKVRRSNYDNFDFRGHRRTSINKYFTRTDEGLVRQNILGQYRRVFYLTSGDIVKSLRWHSFNEDPMKEDVTSHYGWNVSGAPLIHRVIEPTRFSSL